MPSGDYISPDQELDLARDAGADVVRIGVDWSEAEYERGRYDWSGIDERLERVYTRGLRPIIVIGDAPEWARQNNWEDDCHTAPQKLCSHPPAARHAKAFGEFAGDVSARYRAIAYEIWNEPNSPRFWAPRPDPDLYLKLLSEARQGLNKTGSTTPLIVGGLAPVGNEGSGIPASDFLRHLYTNQDSKLFDGVGYHPYPGTRGDWERRFLERMHEIRRVMTQHDDEAGMLWLTEIGVPSRSEDAPDGAPPEKQGAILYWLYRLSAEFNVAAFVIYRLFEDPGEGGRWQSFGVAEADLTSKPAFDDVRRLFGASPGL